MYLSVMGHRIVKAFCGTKQEVITWPRPARSGTETVYPVGSLLLRNFIQEGHRLLYHSFLRQEFIGMKIVTLHDLQVLCGTNPLHTQDGRAWTVAMATCIMSPSQGLVQSAGHT